MLSWCAAGGHPQLGFQFQGTRQIAMTRRIAVSPFVCDLHSFSATRAPHCVFLALERRSGILLTLLSGNNRCFAWHEAESIWRYTYRTMRLHASSAGFGSDNHGEKYGTSQPAEYRSKAVADLDKQEATLQVIRAAMAVIGGVTLLATAVTLASGGRVALVEAIARSGFTAAFALVFISEIGDKTFFIAALLAMQHARGSVLLGATAALTLMTLISVAIGRIFHAVPAQLKTTLPIGEYAAIALLLYFGAKSIKNAWELPHLPVSNLGNELPEMAELAEAEEFIKKAEVKERSTQFEVIGETFSLVFLAEWGDRSMLATIALGATQSPWGVAIGAIAGHVAATGLAVLGGSVLARYISEKIVGYIGGILFLAFAAATLKGIF
eukprot:c21665_g1_i1 orf=506-1651(-)